MKARDVIVGVLFFLALAIAVYFAVTMGGAGEVRMPWDSAQTTYRIDFPHVSGLSQNSPVWISGVPKGKVKTLYVDPNTGKVQVRISLDAEIRLTDNCRAEIIPSSVFGGKAISLEIGDSPRPYDASRAIEGEVVEDLFLAAGRGIGKINEGIDVAVDTIKDINAIIKEVRRGEGPVGTVLFDEKVAGDIAATVENVRVMSDDAKGITADAREITHKINAGDGTAALFLEDADTALRVKNIVKNVEDASDNTVGATRSIKSIVRKIDTGNGFISVLLNDEETGTNLKSIVAKTDKTLDGVRKTFDESGELIARINRGEGTLGKIVTDDTLFNDTLNAVNSLRAGFEDFREQAPITTFASLLFQVFQ